MHLALRRIFPIKQYRLGCGQNRCRFAAADELVKRLSHYRREAFRQLR
jgi:hypothetical protein